MPTRIIFKKDKFVSDYNLTPERIEKACVDWSILETIFNDYIDRTENLKVAAITLSETLRNCGAVHSLKFRIKDPEHLIEKIVRKKEEKPDRTIDLNNYLEEITDCVGIRALHLFKDGWEAIHDFISENCDVLGHGQANIRNGDSGALLEAYLKRGCEHVVHKYGYRSVHYIVSQRTGKKNYCAEIQVRTIFEEGWSEIDHHVRYPYRLDDEVLAEYLQIFNRLAGSADEMGTFIKRFSGILEDLRRKHAATLEKNTALFNQLQQQIEKLGIVESEKRSLQQKVDEIQKAKTSATQNDWLSALPALDAPHSFSHLTERFHAWDSGAAAISALASQPLDLASKIIEMNDSSAKFVSAFLNGPIPSFLKTLPSPTTSISPNSPTPSLANLHNPTKLTPKPNP
jgi:ppGpp synthetase/RelA/SpoT-type nucleotidyltranferase